MNKYNSITENRFKLHELSLDDKSGIDTMVDNYNKSSNLIVETITDESNPQVLNASVVTPVYEELPNVEITPLFQNIKNNSLSNYINKLEDEKKSKIIFGLLVLSFVLLAIAILK